MSEKHNSMKVFYLCYPYVSADPSDSSNKIIGAESKFLKRITQIGWKFIFNHLIIWNKFFQ